MMRIPLAVGLLLLVSACGGSEDQGSELADAMAESFGADPHFEEFAEFADAGCLANGIVEVVGTDRLA